MRHLWRTFCTACGVAAVLGITGLAITACEFGPDKSPHVAKAWIGEGVGVVQLTQETAVGVEVYTFESHGFRCFVTHYNSAEISCVKE